jgi:hypothetical protein
MPRPHYALAVFFVLAWQQANWGQSLLTPHAGLLVLRNGQVLEGNVTRAGDYYVVTLGKTGEIRMPASDVEAVCGSLEEAYEFKLAHPAGSGARAHMELAEWCLRHRLHGHCGEQIAVARRLDPESPGLALLERRLKLAQEAPPPRAPRAPAKSTVVGAEELEKTIRALPEGSVEKFTAIVQPILFNRCGANQCHGPNAKSDFSLFKPPSGQLASRRFTQRNLHATLQQLDRSQPEASPLLTMPQTPHGSALTAVFDKQSIGQLEELTAWVKLTLAVPTMPTAPPTIAESETTLSQPAATPPGVAPAAPTADAAADSAPSAAPPGSVKALRPALDTSAGGFLPRDRYDAEIFNRKYLPPR